MVDQAIRARLQRLLGVLGAVATLAAFATFTGSHGGPAGATPTSVAAPTSASVAVPGGPGLLAVPDPLPAGPPGHVVASAPFDAGAFPFTVDAHQLLFLSTDRRGATIAVSGYVLGGGLSFYAREHGLAAHHVRAFEMITAEGDLVRASADSEPELFWALRGGGGSFGAVVALEIELLPVAEVHAGMMLWDMSAASAVLQAWRDWTRDLDRCATTSLRLMRFPPIPELPPFLSGRAVVVIDGAVLADEARSADLLAPLRALDPELDTFARMPAAGLVDVHMDPPVPSPAVGDHVMLGELDDAALAALLDAAGPDAQDAPLFAELRHLGGALAETQDAAVPGFAGEYALFAVDLVPVPELIPAATARVCAIADAMRGWAHGAPYLNFLDRITDTSTAYAPDTAQRMRRVRDAFDPARTWLAAHPIPEGAPA